MKTLNIIRCFASKCLINKFSSTAKNTKNVLLMDIHQLAVEWWKGIIGREENAVGDQNVCVDVSYLVKEDIFGYFCIFTKTLL